MDLSKHLEKAAEATKRRNYPFAVNLYHQLLALQPDNGEARAGLREALFKKAEQKKPSRLIAMIAGGINLLVAGIARMLGKHAAAARSLERYLALDPLHEGSNEKLADSLRRAGFKRSASAVLRAYATHDPRCLWASRGAGAMLYELGDMPGALAMYEQALKIDPRDQDSLKARKNLAAEGALKSSKLESATSTRDLMKDKDSAAKLEKQAKLYLSPEEVGKALASLEPQLAERPDDQKLLRDVAELREKKRDYEGALDCYERLGQLVGASPELAAKAGPELVNKIGDLRILVQEATVREAERGGDRGAFEGATRILVQLRIQEWKRRVKNQPTDLGFKFELGQALLAGGQLDEAIAELQQAVKDPRRKGEAYLALGRAFRKKGLLDLAKGQLEKATEGQGSHGLGDLAKQVLYELGQIAEEAAKPQEALQIYSRILEQDIGYLDVARKVQTLKSAIAG
jgi:tetratricopeptide (TPR) repeat protein